MNNFIAVNIILVKTNLSMASYFAGVSSPARPGIVFEYCQTLWHDVNLIMIKGPLENDPEIDKSLK